MKLIIFDFDGVLVDTLITCYEIHQEVNDYLPLPNYQTLFAGNIYQMLKSKKNIIHPNFFGEYDSRVREIKIPEELKEMTKKLAARYH